MLVLTGVAVLAAGAYFGNYLFAQAPAGGAGAAAQGGTKVAVINVGHVFNNYVRAKAFKAEIDELLRKPKADATKLIDEMKMYEAETRKPGLDQKQKEQYEARLRNNKRVLEDMDLEMRKLIGKKQEDNLMTLWKEVNIGIEKVSVAYGFQIVLGYGDPMEKDLLNMFPNINRKMQAMDLGSSVPLYMDPNVDISPIVVFNLNKWCERDQPKVTPTSGTKLP
jgi:Skp family chaperone for outer membrane proteins